MIRKPKFFKCLTFPLIVPCLDILEFTLCFQNFRVFHSFLSSCSQSFCFVLCFNILHDVHDSCCGFAFQPFNCLYQSSFLFLCLFCVGVFLWHQFALSFGISTPSNFFIFKCKVFFLVFLFVFVSIFVSYTMKPFKAIMLIHFFHVVL
jgi:hypothetical protein